MKPKIFFLVMGLLVPIMLIPVTLSFMLDREVYLNGKFVTVKIKKLPNVYTSKTELMFLEFNDKTYTKSISRGKREELNIGDSIQMKYSPKGKGHFLFPEENPITIGYALIFGVICMSLGCFYYAFRK